MDLVQGLALSRPECQIFLTPRDGQDRGRDQPGSTPGPALPTCAAVALREVPTPARPDVMRELRRRVAAGEEPYELCLPKPAKTPPTGRGWIHA
jgi:hypothetical protein